MRSLEFDPSKLPLVGVAVKLAIAEPTGQTFVSLAQFKELSTQRFDSFEFLSSARAPVGNHAYDFGVGETFGLECRSGRNLILYWQPNLLSFTWSRDLRETVVYPRFPFMRDQLLSSAQLLVEACGPSNPITFSAVNMSYTKLIKTESRPTGAELQRYFSTDYVPEVLRSSQYLHNVNLGWREKSDVDFRVQIRGLHQIEESGVNGFLATYTAGLIKEGSAQELLSEPLNICHSCLIDRFGEAVTSVAGEEWGRKP